VLLKRHQWFLNLIKKQRGIEIEVAMHGYAHINHAVQPPAKQLNLLKKARAIFENANLEITGFRAPYLASSDRLKFALQDLNFKYDASIPFLWYTEKLRSAITKSTEDIYKRIIKFYQPMDANLFPCISYFDGRLVCIPHILPDDEILIDRLKLTKRHITTIWTDILNTIYRRGEMAVFLFHLERFQILKNIFVRLQTELSKKQPHVWIANLNQIAEWWNVRKKIEINVRDRAGFYDINVECPERSTILIRGAGVSTHTDRWYGRYKVVSSKRFKMYSTKTPAIGISAKLPSIIYDFLHSEGFCVEESESAQKYSIYIDNIYWFDEKDKLKLLNKIEDSVKPLVRVWRWPYNARCCVAFSVDIDAFSTYDFFIRAVFRI
jgi:hypothetical protein